MSVPLSKKSFRGKNIFKNKNSKKLHNDLPKFRFRSKDEIIEEQRRLKYEFISAPQRFSLIINPEETIIFINKLEDAYLNKRRVYVDMEKITLMDYSAVTVLLSVVFSFKARNIKFNGNLPQDLHLANMLVESQFFKYLRKQTSYSNDYIIGQSNQIFTANKEVNSELGLPLMEEATKTIWGQPRTCTGLQRTLIELMQNTNNHASASKMKGEQHWWLSVNHDKKNRKVSFSFVDYGIGIFESLKSKPKDNKWFGTYEKVAMIKNLLTSNADIFKMLLDGDLHLTVTGKPFRGKGLPGLKEVLERNQISDLIILSNDVLADVSNNKYFRIRNQFSGTFVTWNLKSTNINSEWIE